MLSDPGFFAALRMTQKSWTLTFILSSELPPEVVSTTYALPSVASIRNIFFSPSCCCPMRSDIWMTDVYTEKRRGDVHGGSRIVPCRRRMGKAELNQPQAEPNCCQIERQ